MGGWKGRAGPYCLLDGRDLEIFEQFVVCAVKPLHQIFRKDHTVHWSISERHSEEEVG